MTATDQSEWFTKILNMEMEKLEGMKDEFLANHSEKVIQILIAEIIYCVSIFIIVFLEKICLKKIF